MLMPSLKEVLVKVKLLSELFFEGLISVRVMPSAVNSAISSSIFCSIISGVFLLSLLVEDVSSVIFSLLLLLEVQAKRVSNKIEEIFLISVIYIGTVFFFLKFVLIT